LRAGGANAGVIVGVNDDAGRSVAQAGWFYPTMGAQGLTVDAITLRWDETAPAALPDQESVEQAVEPAAMNGVTVALDLFPLHSQGFHGAGRGVCVQGGGVGRRALTGGRVATPRRSSSSPPGRPRLPRRSRPCTSSW